jgi:hypothetical protein
MHSYRRVDLVGRAESGGEAKVVAEVEKLLAEVL